VYLPKILQPEVFALAMGRDFS